MVACTKAVLHGLYNQLRLQSKDTPRWKVLSEKCHCRHSAMKACISLCNRPNHKVFSNRTHLCHESRHQLRLKDIANWNPAQEAQHRLQNHEEERKRQHRKKGGRDTHYKPPPVTDATRTSRVWLMSEGVSDSSITFMQSSKIGVNCLHRLW